MRILLRTIVAAAILIWGYDMLGLTIKRALYPLRLAAMSKPGMLPVPVEGKRARALRDTGKTHRIHWYRLSSLGNKTEVCHGTSAGTGTDTG